ncbi:hypothetical protein BaRGS_00019883, partial [Batillaria attramentaria]
IVHPSSDSFAVAIFSHQGESVRRCGCTTSEDCSSRFINAKSWIGTLILDLREGESALYGRNTTSFESGVTVVIVTSWSTDVQRNRMY